MKRKNLLSKSRVILLGLASAAVLFMLTLPSCNNSEKPKDTEEVAEDHNDAKFANAKEDDADFLVYAEEVNLEEIQLGRLAQTRGTTTKIKELGKMMETDHGKASSDLQALAESMQITLPATLTDDGSDSNNKLMDTKPSDFNKEYIDMMVSGHKDAISKFEDASKDANDSNIRNYASSMLPVLRQHLDEFITNQEQYKKK